MMAIVCLAILKYLIHLECSLCMPVQALQVAMVEGRPLCEGHARGVLKFLLQ